MNACVKNIFRNEMKEYGIWMCENFDGLVIVGMMEIWICRLMRSDVQVGDMKGIYRFSVTLPSTTKSTHSTRRSLQ